ncbi:MAG: hypothetical protein JW762_12920 [Dehalococcoidales bacterium]|nr:hypothetical protein [Dehalococcoidales bacterium]
MKIKNIQEKTRPAFLPQAEPASKLEIGVFIFVMLFISGMVGFLFTLL